MKKKGAAVYGVFLLAFALLSGCSGKNSEVTTSDIETQVSVSEGEKTETEVSTEVLTEVSTEEKTEIPDGVYTVDFDTDSSMFHVSEACNGKGTLTVENGEMTIHVSLMSKKIVNLYPGLAEDAAKDAAELLAPTEDTVTYSDGLAEEVYGFDIPVPALDEEFDVALIGTKGTWYDHKVIVSNPEPMQDEAAQTVRTAELADGNYTIELTFEGGSGKAKVLSPSAITVSEGNATAQIQWSSPYYDYMIVDGEKYLPINTEGNSVFEIPILFFDKPMDVIGDTVAMSTPHEIEYTLIFHSDTMKPAE